MYIISLVSGVIKKDFFTACNCLQNFLLHTSNPKVRIITSNQWVIVTMYLEVPNKQTDQNKQEG